MQRVIWIFGKETCERFSEHYSENIKLEFKDEMVQFKYSIAQLDDNRKGKIVPPEKSLIIGLFNMY